MPKIIDNPEYQNAEEASGGGNFSQMLPGLYKLRIMAIRTEGTDFNGKKVDYVADKQYVKLVYDVAEGEFAGKYSDEYWAGEDKDYGHCDYLSLKNFGFLKHMLSVISACNPGFDAEVVFDADNWAQFIGREFWAVLDGEVDTNDKGYDRWKLSVGDYVKPEDAEAGKHREPKITDNRTAAPEMSTNEVYDDIPFM